MKLFALTKNGLSYIVTVSVWFSSYIFTVLMNFASEEITGGHLVATLSYQLVFFLAVLFAVRKKMHPLTVVSRVLCAVSALACIICTVLSLASVEFSGTGGVLMGYFVMLFVSPFYGFGFIFNTELAVCVYGTLSSLVGIALPTLISRISERTRLAKKYK